MSGISQVTSPSPTRESRPPVPRRTSPLWRGLRTRLRREIAVSDGPALAFLVALTLFMTWLGFTYPDFMAFTALLLPMFMASLWLGPRVLPWFIVFVAACTCVLLIRQPVDETSVMP